MSRSKYVTLDLGGHSTPNEKQKQTIPNFQSTNPESAHLDLTLGIEIECLLLQDTRPNLATSSNPTNLSGRQRIHAILSQPIKVNCSSCGKPHNFSLPLNSVASSHHQQQQIDTDYMKWTVDEDSSLALTSAELNALGDRRPYTKFDRIEVKSRVLNANQPLLTTESIADSFHTHSVKWEDEISAIYERLIETFNAVPGVPGFRLVVNPSSGLHVHIGNGHKGFPLKTIKNVLSMCVANEQAIDSLHSVDRVTGSTLAFSEQRTSWLVENYTDECLDDTIYNVPWSAHFQLLAFKLSLGETSSADGTASDHGYMRNEYPANALWMWPSLEQTAQQNDVPSWLKLIRCAKDVKSLRNLQGAMAHNSTVNLSNILDFSADGTNRGMFGDKKMTVEFRQHRATLRPTEVIAWINVLLNLFTFCHDQSMSEVKDLCEQTWSDPSHDALAFLKNIGVDARTYNHYETFLDLGDNYLSKYARDVHESELQAIAQFGSDDFFLPLCKFIVEEQTASMSLREIYTRIREKLVTGGYGQFEAEYVQQLSVTPAERRKLTIGWILDRPGDLKSPTEPSCFG
ncbi:hypothetical protein M409DRAFT_23425 [Zasmidium cellare ATCC 36951]|uniref:Amidoligase enzyme-domain-containing protein n=1 Tax=Zasmidium cellare ATCC 36951 TaxID=1080233 RepID=A0A6A6CHZ0_ZASCE|nr:uncharacterized protein M409DRAFT_23425 [Zasmidium cellare ATCC 36951]KAF2166233.1 hypothetical protein M409DRAFT_23425 [Zasmidium cellare ATCC 36951]